MIVGFLKRNMLVRKRLFLIFAIFFMVAVTWFFHNREVSNSKHLIQKLKRHESEHFKVGSWQLKDRPSKGTDDIHHFDGVDNGFVDENLHVFRLGSSLLKSGEVDGADSKRSMRDEGNEVPVVFVDEHHEGNYQIIKINSSMRF